MREYQYLPQVREQLDRLLAIELTDELKEFAKTRLMRIDDNMRGNPGHSIGAKLQIGLMENSDDETLKRVLLETYENETGESIQGLS